MHPVVDWAHLHAMSGGALTSEEAFAAVFAFLREHFAGWALDPLHCHFSDNRFGPAGEIEHVPYGQGTLRVAPLVAAAAAAGMPFTLISEARDPASHRAIAAEVATAEAGARPVVPVAGVRSLGSGRVAFPAPLQVRADGDAHLALGVDRAPRLSNIDKPFFAEGYTKGDLAQYYASIAPLLLPHLDGRAIVLARFPTGRMGRGSTRSRPPPPPRLASHRAALVGASRRGHRLRHRPRRCRPALAGQPGLHRDPPLAEPGRRPRPARFRRFRPRPGRGGHLGAGGGGGPPGRGGPGPSRPGRPPKTSGASGLHIYVRLEAEYPYARVRRFVEAVGRAIVGAAPELATMEWDIPRRGRVFIDHNQNVAGKTIASVYSVRPRPGAPVSTPLLWEEVDEAEPAAFTIATIWDRVGRYGDLFWPRWLRGRPATGRGRSGPWASTADQGVPGSVPVAQGSAGGTPVAPRPGVQDGFGQAGVEHGGDVVAGGDPAAAGGDGVPLAHPEGSG